MADQISIQVSGLNKLILDLKLLGIEVSDMKQVFGEISTKAARYAEEFAPKRSGALAQSIRPSKAKNYAAVRAGTKAVPYAGPINYGWPRRNITASHFMQRASDRIEPEVVPMLKHSIDRLIAQKGL